MPSCSNTSCWVGWSLVVQAVGCSLNHSEGKVAQIANSLSAALLAQLAEHWDTNPKSLVQAW